MRYVSLLIATATLAVAGIAQAHPKLLSASPAQDAVVVKPAHIELHFSETLVPAFSKADLAMAAMPGMGAMKMPSTSALASDGKTLIITPAGPLGRGRYTVDWQVVSTDTHKVAGSYTFSVK